MKKQFNKIFNPLTLIILAFAGTLALHNASAATNASFNLTPNSGSYNKDAELTVTVNENSGSDPVNVVTADLSYDQTKLQFVRVDATDSAFEGLVVGSGGNGIVNISRYKSPGTVATDSKFIAKVVFKVLAGSGSTTISFADTSQIVSSSTSSSIWNSSPTGGTYTLTTPAPTPTPTPTPTTPGGGGGSSTGGGGGGSAPTTPAPTPAPKPTPTTPEEIKAAEEAVPITTTDTAGSGSVVSIKVTNVQGAAVKGASVKLGSITATTDETGVASFINIATGKHTVEVSTTEGKTSQQISVKAASTTTQLQQFEVKLKKNTNYVLYAIIAAIVIALAALALYGKKFVKNRAEFNRRFSGLKTNNVVVGGMSNKSNEPVPDTIITPKASIETIEPLKEPETLIPSKKAGVTKNDTLDQIEQKVGANKTDPEVKANEFTPQLTPPQKKEEPKE